MKKLQVPEGYINKTVKITTGALLILLALGLFWESDFDMNKRYAHISCPEDSHTSCKNPLYECRNTDGLTQPECANYENVPCLDNMCEKEYIKPGEHVGREQGFLTKNHISIFLLILTTGGIINHLMWKRKQGEKE